jgi:hypothetical protein
MKRLLLLLTLLSAGFSMAQTQFWADNFDSSPTSGSRTPEENGGTTPTPSVSYFRLTDGSTISQVVPFSGKEASFFWAGEDHNALGTGFTASGAESSQAANAATNELQIDWTGINIAGKSTLSFKGLLAAASTNEPWDNTNACISGVGSTNTDYIIIEYKIDAGAYTPLIRFFNRGSATNGVDKYLFEDTDGNGCGDGTQLTNAFAEFTKSIPGTGTTLSLRIRVFSEGSNEEWGIDNFRLFEVAACTAPTITTNPPTNSDVCAGGTKTISGTATGATAFKWQYDTGSGFTDVPNSAPYSNVTTNTLTITGATAGMNGYDYRLVAMNGVASCFTNSSSSNLRVSAISTSSNTQTNVACFGGNSGNATVIPSGGIAGSYTYSWSPSGGTGATASSLTQGSYTVTVTDAALTSCTATQNFTITQPPVLNGTTVVTNVSCFGGTNGSINLTPSGGAGGYTFSWGGGVTTEDRTALAAGTYSVTITDANSCTKNVTGITVTQPTAVVGGTTTVTNTSCNGGTNGVIDLTPTGGTSPYTYSWGGGVTSQDRISLAAGSYSVTITDANGCTGVVSPITVTQPTAVSGTTTVTNTSCNGGTNGSIDLTPTGGTPGYTYSWGGGITTQDRTALAAGSYSVTITDANGCTGVVSPITVTQPTAVSGTTTVTNVACFGNSTGAINLTPTGGTPGYTFSWGGGITTEDRTSLAAGSYSVTITDANACTGTVNVTVTQPTAAVSGTTVVTNVSCNTGTNGAINLTPTGGAGGYTFSWGGGVTTEDRTGLAAGTYSVTITDINGCTGTVSGITVTQPTAISLTAASQTNVSCNGGSNGAASVNTATGGTPGYTYNWTPGTPTGDGTTSITGLTAGTWTCTVTDANGCVASQNFTVTQPTAISMTASSQTNVSCFGGSNGAASVNAASGGAGGFTYNWTPGTPTGDGTTSVTGLIAGTWTCTVTDANGCVASQSFTVTQPTALSVTASSQTNVSCNGGSNGAAAINIPTGGTPGYTYDWTPGTPTGDGTRSITGLTAGTWTCVVTDANGCTASPSFTVTQPTALSVTAASQTNVSCNGGSNGAASINTPTGGAGGYTYNWTPGNPTGDGTTSVTGLTAGTWTVTVTDANSCVASQSFTVTQPTAISVTAASQTNIACNGGSNGAAAINTPTGGTPGYTYDWSPGTPTGDGTTSINGLTAGTWTVNVTDANGCVASQSFTVTQPTAISVTAASQTNISCNGGSNGAAAINTPTGGTPGYTYDWDPGTPTGDGTTSISGLTAGTYTVTVTDANGCTASQSFTVTQPTALSVTADTQTDVSCNGGSNGSASINTPTGGTPGYTYDWNPGTPTGDGTTSITGLTAGTYTVVATDANGCQTAEAFIITEPTALDVSTGSQVDVLCNGGSTGSATVAPTGGTGTYDYSWSPTGGTAATASGLIAGTYTVTVTDDNNCQNTKTFVITESAPLTNSFSHSACNSYTWGTQTHSISGTYTQTFTASNGCDSTVTLTLSIVSEITNTVTENSCTSYTWAQNGMTYNASGLYIDTIPAAGGCDSIVTLDLTINTPSSSSSSEFSCGSYVWAQNGMTYTASGVYTDTIPNASGCDSIITLNLTIGGSSASQSISVCESYTWAQNGMTYTTSGMYSDTLTDGNGCDSILVLNLTILPSPVAGVTSLSVISLQASGTGTYQWINCTTGQPIAGATNATFTATANGSYAVIVSNGSCSDTSNCVVISQVGLEENNSSFGVSLTPNPTQNDVKITFTGTNEASIVIYDVQGKAVMTADHVQSGAMLSTQAFERGVYMVHILTTSGNHTERLVKQ